MQLSVGVEKIKICSGNLEELDHRFIDQITKYHIGLD